MKDKKSPSQLSFFENNVPKFFGGNLLKGNAKIKRPLSTKHSLHLVLKSKQATGSLSMLQKRNAIAVDRILRKQARQFGIKIYRLVNVGNHLHLVVRITNRELYNHYIRSVTGLIARHVLKKERGAARDSSTDQKSTRFWVARPFTRLVQGGEDFQRLCRYMNKNIRQAIFVAWGFEVTSFEDIYWLNTG